MSSNRRHIQAARPFRRSWATLRQLGLIIVALVMLAPGPVRATFIGFCTDCGCDDDEASNTMDYISAEAQLTRSRFAPSFDAFQNWLVNNLFLTPPGGVPPQNPLEDDPGSPPSDPLAGATGPSAGSPPGHPDTPMAWSKKWLLPWWMNMAQQITATVAWQTLIFGTFLDAKQQIEVQRLMQELAARAHKDYQPSFDICSYGTMIRSLAASEQRAEANTFIASRFGQHRSTGAEDTSATEGQKSDRLSRLTQFRMRYCDPRDNNFGMGFICRPGPPGPVLPSPPATPNLFVDRDIDYAGVMERRLTLDIDFLNGAAPAPTDDEQDLLALASNLYGSEALYRIHEHVFHQEPHKQRILDLRSIMAQRSVAEASFYTIAGMKTPGTPAGAAFPRTDSAATVQYMNIIVQQLGFPVAEVPDVLGVEPSYYAQMEFLTKKLYQDPIFYTNLYDTPANVERKKVTLQAIGLMQDFDTLQSYLRTEMMLSQILELELIKLQKVVQNKIDNLRSDAGKAG